MNRYRKSTIGALVGGSTAGGWLIMDLILPEPIGDYLLFGIMGAVNAAVGWQVVRIIEKKQHESENTIDAEKLGAGSN
ncbi:hypothetical protein [Paucisalibacillus globulus]|uniref:hypothetical protein n=1 Tax=Paucisalibacillus globulus TaxID=351095 RepID=UPI000BB6F2CE|nr:hypothetical protein [Paucisalibacillus globulus]